MFVAYLRSQRKHTYMLPRMRSDGNWEGAWGDGDGERGGGGALRKERCGKGETGVARGS